MRLQAVDDAMKQGYILTKYFYTALLAFEKDPAGLRTAYPDILENIDLKAAGKGGERDTVSSGVSAPELVQLSRLEDRRMLSTAEKRLAAGDPKGAQELAQQALDKKIGDQGRALFILAQVAVANKNREGALENFQKAIQETKDPKVVALVSRLLGQDSGYERGPRGGPEGVPRGVDSGSGTAGGEGGSRARTATGLRASGETAVSGCQLLAISCR